MHIQLFISKHAAEGKKLRDVLRECLPEIPITVHATPDNFGRDIQAVYDKNNVAVVMVAGQKELDEFARLKNIWNRLWTILVLPVSKTEIISLGHSLRPRFMTFAENDFSDVTAVLKHLARGWARTEFKTDFVNSVQFEEYKDALSRKS